MTKRAGSAQKKRARREAAAQDLLKPGVARELELRALREGWLVGKEHASKRRQLMERLLDRGLEEGMPTDQIARIINTVNRAEVQVVRTILAADNAAKDTKPVVIVQQNNSQVDTLAKLIESMSPDEAQELLNKHGTKLAELSSIQTNSPAVSSQSITEISSPKSM